MEAAHSLFTNPINKFTLQQRRDYVRAYQESGKTLNRWCGETGISINSMKNWLYRQNLSEIDSENNNVRWTAVTVREETPPVLESVSDIRSAIIRIDISGVILYVDDKTPPVVSKAGMLYGM